MNVITTTQGLIEFCTAISNDAFITVDTEFLRETTYWPKLCLVQVAGEDHAAVIDPLAAGIDMSPFWAVMDNRDILKVFHAARQDLEIFYQESGRLPTPLFDTQIAGMVLGLGEQISYGDLIHHYTGTRLDKSERFTDWSRRPLSPAQLTYALADVVPLRVAYGKIMGDLAARKRTVWALEEHAPLLKLALYAQDPHDAWQRVKLKPHRLKEWGVLVELSRWREAEAQRLNVPRGRILKDDMLQEVVLRAPTTREMLFNTRGLNRGIEPYVEAILEAINTGITRTAESLPPLKPHRPFPPKLNVVVDMLKLLLRAVAEAHDVAPKVLATNDDLQALAQYHEKAEIDALNGWRKTLFGTYALQLVKGELQFGLNEKSQLKMLNTTTGEVVVV